MNYIMDVINSEGTPFRVVFLPNGEGYPPNPAKSVVEFYDRRYQQFTHNGQFVSRYYAETLFASADRYEDYGLNLQGGVEDWYVDKGAMVQIMDWLEELSIRLD